MRLYHYTSLEHLKAILEDGEIKTTASNLLKPVNMRLENGTLISDTDYYKPVVWFTTVHDFQKAKGCGLEGGSADKTEVAVCVEMNERFQKWDVWANRNRINRAWFNTLKRTAPQWETFYISEQPIPTDENVSIIFRPDIQERFQKDMGMKEGTPAPISGEAAQLTK